MLKKLSDFVKITGVKNFRLTVRDYQISILFFLIGVLTRLPLIEKMQSHWDASLFSIAVLRYSIEKNTPPIPGHPLYIAFGRLFYYFIADPHVAILLVSVLFSGLSAGAIYVAGKTIFNRTTGVIAALIFLSGSTFYYFGITPYSFILLPFSWSMIIASIYLLAFKKRKTTILIAFFYAFGIGVRPQDALFLTPIVLYSFFIMSKMEKLKFIASFVVTFLAWFVPLSIIEGGGLHYVRLILSHPPRYPIGFHQQDLELMIKDYFLSFGIAGIFLIYYFRFFRRKLTKKQKKILLFYSIWILPNFIFNLIVISVHAGYQMDYLIAFLFLLSFAIFKLIGEKKVLLWSVVSLIVITNLFLFFWDRDPKFQKVYRPSSFHYSDIRKNDIKLGGKVEYIKKNYNPSDTLIITTSTLWSPYMYHLKEYHQYSIEALFVTNPKFINQRRDSYRWNVNEYNRKEKYFIVPSGIRHLILVDDEFVIDLHNLLGQKRYLLGNSYIIDIPVAGGEKINYGYHLLERE